MSYFIDLRDYYSKVKILILGPYEFLKDLNNLVNFLKERGFKKTYLAKDLINIPENLKEDKEAFIYRNVKELMLEVDFNIFIIFREKSDSVVAELTTLIQLDVFKDKLENVLIHLPNDYPFTIVKGLISDSKLNIFEYQNDIEIQLKTLTFIKTNLKIKF